MGTNEQSSHTLSYWVIILKNARSYYFLFKCFYIWQTCTFIVYLYAYAVTITMLNLFMKILTVSFKCPYLELSKFKQPYLQNPLRYFIHIFRFFLFLSNTLTDRRLKTKPIKLSKFAFSAVGLLIIHMESKSINHQKLYMLKSTLPIKACRVA